MWARVRAIHTKWVERIGSVLWTKEAAGIASAVLCGALLTWLLTEFSELGYAVSADTGYLSVVGVAVLVLVFFSGRLTEFSFGGVSAKFQAVAKNPVRSDSIAETLHLFAKASLEVLPDQLEQASKFPVAAIGLQLPPRSERSSGYFVESVLLAYAREFSAVIPNSYIIVTNDRGEFVGAVEASRIAALCVCGPVPPGTYSGLLAKFVEYANRGDECSLLKLGLLNKVVAKCGTNNDVALRKMQDDDLDFLVLVDENGAPQKIAIRREIIEQLLLALAA